MKKTHKYVEKVANELKINVVKMLNTDMILENIKQRYFKQNTKIHSINSWEKIDNGFSVCNNYAWEWINEFITNTNTIMFFVDDEQSLMFQNGDDIVAVLSETYGFEFFLTDEEYSFLLCYNHHNYLIASGTAKEWLQNRDT